MCNGQSHFHINSLHPEGSLPPLRGSKVSVYCIWLPVSIFSHRVLFFLTLSTWTRAPGQLVLSNRTLLWVTSMRRCPLTFAAIAAELTCDLWKVQEMRGHAWSESSRSWYHVSTNGRRKEKKICIPLLYCQRRCLNLIKCLITIPRSSSHRW